MATRDRTKTFERFRDAAVSRRGPRPPRTPSALEAGSLSNEANASLLGNDALLGDDGADAAPPGWLRFVDEAQLDIDSIKAKGT